jgi:probable addiction module antidote protein/putative addiction module killer protein
MTPVKVRRYQTAEGNVPLSEWLDGLRDGRARARVVARLDRLNVGLLGDWRSVGEGVCELRIDYGAGYRVYYVRAGRRRADLAALREAINVLRRRTSRRLMATGKTTKPASLPFRAADHLKSQVEIAEYLEAMLADGDERAVPVALRTVADAVGGMTALAEKTGLSRETLYRTLSERGNPRLDTLAAILAAFGLRLSVQPRQTRSRRRAHA